MSELKTVGDLCEALASPTPAPVRRELRKFDLDHGPDYSDVLTANLRARYMFIPLLRGNGLLKGESVVPDVPEDWLVVGGDLGQPD